MDSFFSDFFGKGSLFVTKIDIKRKELCALVSLMCSNTGIYIENISNEKGVSYIRSDQNVLQTTLSNLEYFTVADSLSSFKI